MPNSSYKYRLWDAKSAAVVIARPIFNADLQIGAAATHAAIAAALWRYWTENVDCDKDMNPKIQELYGQLLKSLDAYAVTADAERQRYPDDDLSESIRRLLGEGQP